MASAVTANTVNIAGPSGPIGAYCAHPAGRGRYPAVIMYFDAAGMREDLQAMARRVAEQGYFCLLPDLYYRIGTLRFRLSHRDAALSAVIRAASRSLGQEQVAADSRAMFAWLDGHSRVCGPMGLIGHGQGGQFVVSVAGRLPDRVRAGAAFCPTGMVGDGPQSPHLLAGPIKGALYLAFAEHDPSVPPGDIPDLSDALKRNRNLTFLVETHAGTHPGFCFPDSPAYDRAAADVAWQRLFEVFARQLRP